MHKTKELVMRTEAMMPDLKWQTSDAKGELEAMIHEPEPKSDFEPEPKLEVLSLNRHL